MLVIIDMLPAVGALADAFRAVAEIHLRVGLVGDAADRAAMKRLVVPFT
jgi:hypothetical protein